MGVIIFNGKSSRDYGIEVEHFPDYEIPEKDYEQIHVPGRNGDILIDKKSYQNVNRSYEISSGSEDDHTFASIMFSIINWLHSGSGYCVLMDSYEPDYYRKAMYNESASFTNIHDKASQATISFICKPQRYLVSGDEKITFSSPGTIFNPTSFSSKPIIKVTGRGYGTLQIGSYIQNLSLLTTSIGNSTGITRMKVNADRFIRKIGSTAQNTFVFTCTGNSSSVNIISSETNPITAVVSNIDSFISVVGSRKLKKYIFVYNAEDQENPYWTLDDVVINSISDYFISITGTPVNGDVIEVNVLATWSCVLDETATNVNVGEYGITFSGPPNVDDTMTVNIGSTITIDCEAMDCYNGTENKNSFVELQNGFPELVPGDNEILFNSYITSVEVIPKWWIL